MLFAKRSLGEPTNLELDHRRVDPRFLSGGQLLVVLAQAAIPSQPSEGALDDTSPGQGGQAWQWTRLFVRWNPDPPLGSLDHGQRDSQRLLRSVNQRATIAHIHPDPLHHWVLQVHWFEELTGSVAISQWTTAFNTIPPVSTSKWRLRPLSFLAPSWPRIPLFPWFWRSG